MPRWDARSRHHVEIQAEPAAVYHALLTIDFGRNPILRVFMAVRLLPALIFTPRQAWKRWQGARAARLQGPMGHLLSGAFIQLEASPPTELILGLTGRFWTPAGGLVPTDPATFRDPVPPGLARATWNFQLQAVHPSRTLLGTETRVLCGDEATRRRFLRYWTLIRGGSGVIRWALLRQVKLVAEGAGA
jgi:hypothetical protein